MLTSLMPDNVTRKSTEDQRNAKEASPSESVLPSQQERFLIRILNRLSIARRHSRKEWKKTSTPPNKRVSLPTLRYGRGLETNIPEESDEFFASLSRYRRSLIVYARRFSFDLSTIGSSGRTVHKDIDIMSELLERKMERRADASATEMAEDVQNFYTAVERRLQEAVSTGECSREQEAEMMDEVENQLMIKLHYNVFESISAEECREDVALMQQISDLHWVTAEHLAAKADETDPNVAELLDKAMIDIAEINFRVSPIEKLECIMNCSKKIFAILKNHPQSTEGADDYLPLLVYIILRVNPPRLHSNIRYILQFSSPSRVLKGEEGYYFTHLCSVVSYIQTVTAESLNMSQEEFDYYRSCENKKRKAIQNSRYLTECLCEVYNRAAEKQALGRHQERLFKKTLALKVKAEEMKKNMLEENSRRRDSRMKIQNIMAKKWTTSLNSSFCAFLCDMECTPATISHAI